HLCFIESGLASTVIHDDSGKSIETALVGRESITGWPALLGAETAPDETIMCVGGRGFLIPAVELRHEMENDARLRALLLGYVNICLLQIGQLALANGQYSLRERLARWLLMCHDRLDTDDLPITHEFLSTVLGVRRPGITNELHILEGIHAIRASRGNVRIVNRSILQDLADTTYGIPENEYEKLVARIRKDVATPSVTSI
ncbi:Crp/Fnr family transcriptional regulator, partial [Agrobacterium tumefaciens]|uniref:Crp/Fnr family transcriptional regulator n=1 Tax=Agrobacterium tumefaciens TaxID=358 RepID=UPI00287DC130